jgi:hypothetical protein
MLNLSDDFSNDSKEMVEFISLKDLTQEDDSSEQFSTSQ